MTQWNTCDPVNAETTADPMEMLAQITAGQTPKQTHHRSHLSGLKRLDLCRTVHCWGLDRRNCRERKGRVDGIVL